MFKTVVALQFLLFSLIWFQDKVEAFSTTRRLCVRRLELNATPLAPSFFEYMDTELPKLSTVQPTDLLKTIDTSAILNPTIIANLKEYGIVYFLALALYATATLGAKKGDIPSQTDSPDSSLIDIEAKISNAELEIKRLIFKIQDLKEKINAKKIEAKRMPEKYVSSSSGGMEAMSDAKKSHPWSKLSSSSLSQKTVKQLIEVLSDQGISTTDENGETLSKEELLSSIKACF